MLRLSAILSLSVFTSPAVHVHSLDMRQGHILGNGRQDGRSSAMEDASVITLDLDMEDRSDAGLPEEKRDQAFWLFGRSKPKKPTKTLRQKRLERKRKYWRKIKKIKKIRALRRKRLANLNLPQPLRSSSENKTKLRSSSENKTKLQSSSENKTKNAEGEGADLNKQLADLNKQVADLNKQLAALNKQLAAEQAAKEQAEQKAKEAGAKGLLEEVKKVDRAVEREVADLKVQLAAEQKAKERAEQKATDAERERDAALEAKETPHLRRDC